MSDFEKIVMQQQKNLGPTKFEGNLLDYMEIVQKNPDVAMFTPSRIYKMIMKHGVSPIPENRKTKGYEDMVKYNFFNGKIFGTYEAIHDIMKFMKASARRTETGK